ncbi:hypothetical protein AALP_AA1G062100 [Arabis alpina]|uniref:Transmembrane protein n=1 Tax=Arabis alpina TaxID=50452 RepID=A0A087HLG2_ARAAL|nr:hypothetical protein AALP_AA1G062100 [Arabis alpina]
MVSLKKWVSLKKKKQEQEKEEVVSEKETQIRRRLRNLFSPSSSSFKWKRVEILQMDIVDGVVFKFMYVVEGLVLVSTLCFFYLCCGCHI